jgi:hypothetical protein
MRSSNRKKDQLGQLGKQSVGGSLQPENAKASSAALHSSIGPAEEVITLVNTR